MIEDESDDLYFSNQIFRDYFAAKHIINAISVFENGCINTHDIETYFEKLGLSGIWFDNVEVFPEKNGIYKLIGEICGDYINDVESEDFYTFTLLDKYLDICRKLNGGYNIENVINVKKVMHKNVICNVDFSWLNLPLILPSDVSFSIKGEYPCDFYGCRIYRVAENDNEKSKILMNCDFSDAVFLDKKSKEQIHELGGFVDFESENFMDKYYRELVLPWIKVFS